MGVYSTWNSYPEVFMVHPLIHIYFHKVDLMKVDLFTLRRAADFEMIPQNILHFSFTENHPFMDGHSKIDDQPTRSVVEVSLIQPKGCLCFLTNCTITSKLMKSIVGKAYTSYARKKKKTDVARTFWWAKGGGEVRLLGTAMLPLGRTQVQPVF